MLNENTLEPAGHYNAPQGFRVGRINFERDAMGRTSPELAPLPSLPRRRRAVRPIPDVHGGNSSFRD
jgi:hypothetical protein